MAINEPGRIDVVKAAVKNDKVKDTKFSESGGSVFIGGSKYTNASAAVKKLNEKK
jgi:hypothetical protein